MGESGIVILWKEIFKIISSLFLNLITSWNIILIHFSRGMFSLDAEYMLNKPQKRGNQPYPQGEHSQIVWCDVKGFHSRGIKACRDVTTSPTCFGIHCEQAALILNVPYLRWKQQSSSRQSHVFLIHLSLGTWRRCGLLKDRHVMVELHSWHRGSVSYQTNVDIWRRGNVTFSRITDAKIKINNSKNRKDRQMQIFEYVQCCTLPVGHDWWLRRIILNQPHYMFNVCNNMRLKD